MNDWFNILKTQRTITDVGFDFDLPEEEPPEKEDKDCCQKFKEGYVSVQNEYRSVVNKVFSALKASEVSAPKNFIRRAGVWDWEALFFYQWKDEEAENKWMMEMRCYNLAGDIDANIDASKDDLYRIKEILPDQPYLPKLLNRILALERVYSDWEACKNE